MDDKSVSQHPQSSAKFCLIPAKHCATLCFLGAQCLGPYLGHFCFPGVPSEIPEGTPVPSVQVAKLLINEVNADNPGGGEDAEYIELFYTGQTCFNLQGYWLVLYNGKSSQAYRVLDLSGHHTDNLGYFLVGSSSMSPAPMIRLPPNTIQNGADAVALYHSSTPLYAEGMAVTARGLLDAVVYSSREPEKAEQLLRVLLPGQSILYENDSHSTQDESLSRCYSLSTKLQSSFQVGRCPFSLQSPGGQMSVLPPQSLRGQWSCFSVSFIQENSVFWCATSTSCHLLMLPPAHPHLPALFSCLLVRYQLSFGQHPGLSGYPEPDVEPPSLYDEGVWHSISGP